MTHFARLIVFLLGLLTAVGAAAGTAPGFALADRELRSRARARHRSSCAW
jgi:hypothetical protein